MHLLVLRKAHIFLWDCQSSNWCPEPQYAATLHLPQYIGFAPVQPLATGSPVFKTHDRGQTDLQSTSDLLVVHMVHRERGEMYSQGCAASARVDSIRASLCRLP
jgi:hypothetical protein